MYNVKDNRTDKMGIIGPAPSLISRGVTNYIYSICDNGKPIGDIEVGTDGFVQIRIFIGNKLAHFNGKGLNWLDFGE